MKKTIVVLLALAMVFCLYACGNNAENNGNGQNTEPGELETSAMSTLEPTPTPELAPSSDVSFEENEALTIVAAFVYDNDTYVVVENTGDQAILNYNVAYINFDKNGFVTTTDSDGYKSGRANTANIIPGDKYLAGWYGANGNYAVATVTKIEFADGTTWEATESQTDNWAQNASKEFSVDNQKAIIAQLKETGTLAETNEYAVIVDYSIKHGNRYSEKHDLHFSIKNTSDMGIARINVFVLEYDENGFPVSVSPYDTYCVNGHQTGGIVNLIAGQSDSYSDDLFLSPTTSQVKVAISYIEFQDGSEWTNPYIFEWIIGNASSY